MEEERQHIGRTRIGDIGGNRQRAQSFSKRASKGNLDTIRKRCPFCNHHKALVSVNKTKCSKCKKEYK